MDVITTYLHLPITDPTWIFFLVLCVILFAPMIFSKLHIPHLIGMILAGVLIGEHGLNILARDASFELFGKVGIYFIMFLAGLEMDLQNLKQNRVKGFIFGAITSIIPFVFGFVAGYNFLDYSLPASLLLACIFASHTLVAYPIVGRYGLSNAPSVTISVAATMVALLSALMMLAGISGTLKGTGDVWFWLFFGLKFAIFIFGMFFLLPRLIRVFFRKYSDPVIQFTFTLAVVLLSAATAELCGLEGIFGAFLAGLVLNRFVPNTSPLMNRIEFVGNALFIPYFLIGVGMLVNVAPMFQEGKAAVVVAIMVIAGTLSKYLAALISRKLFRMSRREGVMMFGLTEAHAAGALAMVMVGVNLEVSPGVPLMNGAVLDGVVMMILISCIISSIATDQAAKKLKVESEGTNKKERRDSTARDDEKILIPINEPNNIETLMSTAFMMRNQQLSRGLICLNIINDADLSDKTQAHSRKCLEMATKLASAADVPVQTQTRLAVNFVTATIHALRENDASELLIGLHRQRHNDDSFLGQFAQGLINGMSRQLIIVNMNIPANTIRKIVVAVPEKAEYEKGFYRWINRIARMAEDLGCQMTFYATETTNSLILRYMRERHKSVRDEYEILDSWNDFPALRHELNPDHLLVVVTARRGSISYQKAFNKLPHLLQTNFAHSSLMLIYPDQQEQNNDFYAFTDPHHHDTATSNTRIGRWLSKWIGEMG
ncbi:MAG: cation:proton antiporter [Bacteroidaceae bacterium]|nr:cation:proton antiporter [Bacteroidaceae bacterium]